MYVPDRSESEEWLGVVIAVPEPWVSLLTEARLGLGDEAGARVPAHITVMPPIAVSSDNREAVFEHLAAIAKQHRPFRITVQGTGTFLPVNPVVYLSVEEGERQCADLADDIRNGPLDYDPRFPYHPHITLAYGEDQGMLEKAMEWGADFEASWMVPGFRLDRVEATGSYASVALFNFSS
ncbi:2'-5' RNA ligase family protein [Actinomyces minihominis]|uniref:2'-5' RNA ligase family protein n=1 Tax=Actinomyces minihominis TaxID=2002838 RepID=UPI000C07A6C0|nr:2'-5' RNA ligase family protein [Actinomyces minihominis]